MTLLADSVSFRKPFFKVFINVRQRGQAEMMNVVSGRNRVNTTESRVLESACQNDVAVNPSHTGSQLGEGHAHLKRDAGFLREHDHRSAAPHRLESGIKDRADFRWLAPEVGFQIVRAAKVGLIAIGETAFAGGALPERA